MRSIQEVESKGFCEGKHKLTYGAWQERQEAETEQLAKLEEIKEENSEPKKPFMSLPQEVKHD